MSDDFEPVRLVLIRHGESVSTVERVIGGHRTCAGLSDLGKRQTEALRSRLERTGELSATALIASHYPRAQQTAEVIAPVLGLEIKIDAAFGEHDPGPECDGMSFKDFVDAHGMPDWESDPYAETFPGGETVAQFHHRVGSALSRMCSANAGGTVVIACHGGVIDVAFRTLLGLSMTGGFELHTLNTSITEFAQTRPGKWRLVRYNDVAHLEGLPKETSRE